ncbi:type II secretion system F family protein [Idiomarina abyssalis]|uniref:Type II secretion system F family protein n=1 Tax=Idiomarina abyssalis TaxID=86102 RepID=A0A8I1GE37_9GAMM|nr:type II secretion system F family protein [Idiomarina abyssalis]MBJ7265590.1 type II secretion system F family protein [Idiomarina abyssalis]MBJ7316736.1 type II secretion system F family protein [Idiomarina abyssalis]
MSFLTKLRNFSLPKLAYDFDDITAIFGIDDDLIQAINQYFRSWRFNKTQQMEFILDFQGWINDGGRVVEACEEIVQTQKELGKESSPQAKAAQSIRSAVGKGLPIAEGMKGWFNKELMTVFRVGEKTNTLSESINQYSDIYKQMNDMKKGKFSALLMPFVYTIGLMAIGIMYAHFVIPQFINLLSYERMPTSIKFVYSFYGFIYEHVLVIASLATILLVFYRFFLVYRSGTIRRAVQRVYPFSPYSNLLAVKTTRMLGLLVGKVYNVNQACYELASTAKPFHRWHLKEIAKRDKEGSSYLHYTVDTGLIPSELVRKMRITSKMGDSEAGMRALSLAGEKAFELGVKANEKGTRTLKIILLLIAAAQLIAILQAFFAFSQVSMSIGT